MKTLRGAISDKEKLSIKVAKIASQCKSLVELNYKLEIDGLKPYHRNGKFTGLWLGNRKFRLTTLGVGKDHLRALTKEQKRLDNLNQNRNYNSKHKDLDL